MKPIYIVLLVNISFYPADIGSVKIRKFGKFFL